MKPEFHQKFYISSSSYDNIIAMSPDKTNHPIADKVEIYDTDDERLRVLGEVLITDVSRTVLKLLLGETLTANEIAIKTEYSLQLVRYHLKENAGRGLVEISKIGKNTKAHDMKYYSATKFAIVILPSKFSARAKSSKSLFNSFKSIYRFGAIGVVAICSWFATSMLQGTGPISDVSKGIQESPSGGYTSYNPFYNAVGGPYSGDGGTGSGASLEEILKLAREKVTVAVQHQHAGSGTSDFFWPLVIGISVLAFGLSIEIVLRVLKIKKENF